ncbi:DNA-packaging protein FI [Salmonella enterica subsp. enterica serovar Choleraesuis]|nr:DNA-packaging protein FI [Salmonella enterica subsp. enterica serovar Choleraesuis]
MTKEELIQRLKALAQQLGRDVNLTGSKEELALRVAELEEELDDDAAVEDEAVTGSALPEPQPPEPPESPSQGKSPAGGYVSVEALAYLHVEALHVTKSESIHMVTAGTVFRLPAAEAEELERLKLVRLL